MTETTPGTFVSPAEYAQKMRKSERTIWRWLEAGRLPGAWQEEGGKGRWWLPLDPPTDAPAAVAVRKPSTAPQGVPDVSRDMTVVTGPSGPSTGPLGMMGPLEDAAAALGTTVGGLRRLYADMAAQPGLPMYVGPYGRNGALRVYAPPK